MRPLVTTLLVALAQSARGTHDVGWYRLANTPANCDLTVESLVATPPSELTDDELLGAVLDVSMFYTHSWCPQLVHVVDEYWHTLSKERARRDVSLRVTRGSQRLVQDEPEPLLASPSPAIFLVQAEDTYGTGSLARATHSELAQAEDTPRSPFDLVAERNAPTVDLDSASSLREAAEALRDMTVEMRRLVRQLRLASMADSAASDTLMLLLLVFATMMLCCVRHHRESPPVVIDATPVEVREGKEVSV